MKTAFFSLLALGSASAFAPSQSVQRNVALSATAELDGLVGVDIETGKKIVRIATFASLFLHDRVMCWYLSCVKESYTESCTLDIYAQGYFSHT
jgi:hypothetical protein